MRFNPWNEEGRRGKRSTDAVRSSGQWLHGGLGWSGVGRRRTDGGGGAHSASVLKEEEEAKWAEWAKRPNTSTARLGRVGPVRPAGLKGRTDRRGY
jgi:hypothetical protein